MKSQLDFFYLFFMKYRSYCKAKVFQVHSSNILLYVLSCLFADSEYTQYVPITNRGVTARPDAAVRYKTIMRVGIEYSAD